MSVKDFTPIVLKSTKAADGSAVEVEMEPVFELDGDVYQIPKKPSAGLALGYLEKQSTLGADAAVYWMMVSIAGHFFFSTTCWWRADRSDSPPGGKACQYSTFLSRHPAPAVAGAPCARASGASKARPIALKSCFMVCLLLVLVMSVSIH